MRYLTKLLIIFLNISRDRLLIYWQTLSNLISRFAFREGLRERGFKSVSGVF